MAVSISSFPAQNEMKMLQLFLSAPLVVVFATRLSPKIRIATDAHKCKQIKVILRPENIYIFSKFIPRGIYSAMISYCLPRPILSDVISFRTCINSLRFEVDIQYIHKPTSILPSGNLI